MANEKKSAPSEETPKKDKPIEESAPEKLDLEEVTEGKFKDVDELAKAYKEAEKKLGEQSEEVRQSREFAQVLQPLLDEIRSDPELFKQLDERLRKRSQPADASADASRGEKAIDQNEMRDVASDLILARFEEKHGIDKLPTSERKDVRQAIGDTIYRITGSSLSGVDLRRLGTVLEDAYILANKDKLIEKSKLEALASARGIEEAGIPSLPSSPGGGEGNLTSEEADIAEKLGLARKQYLEGKESLAKK